MITDSVDAVWRKFCNERSQSLIKRFPGSYRAEVIETNDPLNIGRIRIKCPDLHDFDLAATDCPWAVPAQDLGGPRSKRFVSPCIGDKVWISFERQHPYGLIYTGFADPTRRKMYAFPQITQQTPLSVNVDGTPLDQPQDYEKEYLPKDGRPMSHGWQDRYGNMDIHSAVGYFPKEHDRPPPPADYDAIQGSKFKQQSSKPLVNNPDRKYMVRLTKYGNMLLMSDQGYYWKKEGDLGEFEGDFAKDEQFELKRWKAYQKFFNEDHADSSVPGGDQRRISMITRYGSRFEMRDTGWAQIGPQPSKSRDEFGEPRTLSKESQNDFRWIKLRTKGGMLFQAYDKGFDPQEDEFIKRKLSEEYGDKLEKEGEYWKDKDARWMRLVTRYGLKIVLDDRGSDTKKADQKETPRGNGILIKGRRTPASKGKSTEGDPKGFYWEFNENDKANHTMWGTPLGQAVELNDRYQYAMIATSMGKEWAAKWQGIKENEFIRKPLMMKDPEKDAYHLKLDSDNEYLRLKTRGGNGPGGDEPVNPSGITSGLNQGLEARDGQQGDGPWVEIVDSEHRGVWWSKKYGLSVWRAKEGRKMYSWMDDENKKIVIYNNEEEGTIEIYTNHDMKFISKRDMHFQAKRHINFRAGEDVRFQAGETKVTVKPEHEFKTTALVFCKKVVPIPSGEEIKEIKVPEPPAVVEPTDRGKCYNQPFEECPIDEVEHKLS